MRCKKKLRWKGHEESHSCTNYNGLRCIRTILYYLQNPRSYYMALALDIITVLDSICRGTFDDTRRWDLLGNRKDLKGGGHFYLVSLR